jgi:CheY-like chemotaxis protein
LLLLYFLVGLKIWENCDMTADDHARVLIVDDEVSICEVLSRWLKREGYVCYAASCGEEALNLLSEKTVDLVLSDIMMPGMSGIDLLNIIRPLYPDVAVVMITAVNDKSTAMLALDLGAYGYVIKPFEKNEILIHVAGALSRRRERKSLQHRTGSIAVEVPIGEQRFRKVMVPLDQFLHSFRSGQDDAGIMEEFDLSSGALNYLTDQLVAMGELNPKELLSRASLASPTIILDSGEFGLPESPAKKPIIDAADALQCIKSGMSDAALMKRYAISAKGLQSLFRKLVAEGVIDKTVIDGRLQVPKLSIHRRNVPESDQK